MDCNKISNQPKKEKKGADGLTKKERRALKVQAKKSNSNVQSKPGQAIPNNVIGKAHVELVNKTEINQAKLLQALNNNVDSNQKKQLTEKAEMKVTEQKQNTANDNSQREQLTEKELRKLEWEKRLAEQKQNTEIDNKAGLSKTELKAKRREQQEAQRLAKADAKSSQKVEENPQGSKHEFKNELPKIAKKSPVKKELTKKGKLDGKVQLVQHLYTISNVVTQDSELIVNYSNVHPAFVRLGVQYSTKTIIGSNARCLALLAAVKHLVNDLKTPPKQEFCRYLESVLQSCTNHLQQCRLLAVSMTNALRSFKLQLTQLNTNLSDNEKKAKLLDIIEIYIHEEINKAGEAISMKVRDKITDGDVVLTYGCSSLIRKILSEAQKEGKKFDVVVVDGRPLLEGREMLRRLAGIDIHCKYVLINSLSYIMGSVTKVLLGAHALLTNGFVMSRIGTAQVALVAQAFNKPVLVCCETYKFSERVQTDSMVYNELDDPAKLSHVDTLEDCSHLKACRDNSKLIPLNLLYDVTPPGLVTAVVTELAILPCTSVPVVLRINANETT